MMLIVFNVLQGVQHCILYRQPLSRWILSLPRKLLLIIREMYQNVYCTVCLNYN